MDRRFGCETCNHCAICCRGWDIELTKEDIRTLAGLGYRLGDFLEIKASPIIKTVGRQRNCTFLDGGNMCVLEKRHGHAAKPHTCRLYPKISSEALARNDYFFYEYGGKTLSRDMLSGILGTLADVHPEDLFNALLFRLEKMRKQKAKYVDVFNYDARRRHSDLSKALARSRIRKLARRKMRGEDLEALRGIETRTSFEVGKFLAALQKRLGGSDAINPNLPEMLLAYLLVLRREQPREAKKLAEYFFEWNAKRF
jgi:Fe-S-cluster containining protein